MLTRGDKKLTLFQGDRKPYSLFKGSKQISGAVKTNTTKWEAPYKAQIPKVEVDGMGFQGYKHSKNLFDISKVKHITNPSTQGYVSNNLNGTLSVQASTSSSGVGILGVVGSSLKDFCPELEVGQTAVLNFKSTGKRDSIYLPPIGFWYVGQSLKITQEILDSTIYLYANGDTSSFIAVISEFQIEEGTAATPYEPYWTIGDKPVLSGKNLFNIKNTNYPSCALNIKIENNYFSFEKETASRDGSAYVGNIMYLEKGTYFLSGRLEQSDGQTGGFGIYDMDKGVFIINASGSGLNHSFTITEPKKYSVNFYSSYASDKLVKCYFYNVRIEKGTAPTEYEPYCGGSPTPNPYYPIEPVFNSGSKLELKGKNLFNGGARQTKDWIYYYFNSPKELEAGIYTLSGEKGVEYYQIRVFDRDGNSIFDLMSQNNSPSTHITFELKKPTVIKEFMTYKRNNELDNIQLEEGDKATLYSPYTPPQVVEVPVLRAIPDTEYKDTYNPQTQIITRRIKEVIFDDTWTWHEYTWQSGIPVKGWYNDYGFRDSPATYSDSRALCNQFEVFGTIRGDRLNSCYLAYSSFNFASDKLQTLEEVKAHLKEHPIKVWYPLAEPQEEKVTTPPLIQDWSGELKATWGDCGIPEVRAEVFTEYED